MAEHRSADTIVSDAVAKTHWNDQTLVGLLLEYIEHQQSNAAFSDFISEKVDADDEDGG